jgi:hypothetical protein
MLLLYCNKAAAIRGGNNMDNNTIKMIREEVFRMWHDNEERIDTLFTTGGANTPDFHQLYGYKYAFEKILTYLDEQEV